MTEEVTQNEIGVEEATPQVEITEESDNLSTGATNRSIAVEGVTSLPNIAPVEANSTISNLLLDKESITNLEDEQLVVIHTHLHSIYGAIMKGDVGEFTIDEIMVAHKIVFDQLRARNLSHPNDIDKLDVNASLFLNLGIGYPATPVVPGVEIPYGLEPGTTEYTIDPTTYDPIKRSVKQLKEDWAVVSKYYTAHKQGIKVNVSYETIVNLAKLIYNELTKRKISFKPSNMSSVAKELFDIVSKGSVITQDSADIEMSEDEEGFLAFSDVVNKFENFKIVNECVCLIGSTINKEEGKLDREPKDIDILIKLYSLPEFLKKGIETRIQKMFPESMIGRIHFVWGVPAGPHDSYVPLYDMKFERIEPAKIITMSEMELVERVSLGSSFLSMKSSAHEGSTLFYSVSELVDRLKGRTNKWVIETKYDGYHAIIHKQGSIVKIYSDQEKDITSAFPTLANEIRKLSPKDLIIEGEIVPYYQGKPLGRSTLMRYVGAIKSGKRLNDSGIVLHTWDCIWLGSSLADLPLTERKAQLHTLAFTNHIRYVPTHEATNETLKSVVEQVAKDRHSEGAMVKSVDLKYRPGKTSDIIKYRKTDPLNVIVIKKNQTAGAAWNFQVGISVSEEESKKIIPKYLTKVNDKTVLNLHNTFNTVQTHAEPGDRILVQVQEVWRHEQDGNIRYSLHKPRVIKRTNEQCSPMSELDRLAVSKGESVVEHNETLAQVPKEGQETADGVQDLLNFPERFQRNFKEVMNTNMWLPYVMHHHGRHNSWHTDVRHLVPAGYLEGITINTPGNTTGEDEFNEEATGVRCELKSTQPKEWLTFEGIVPPGGTGSTKNYPALFVIVSKGKYRVSAVDDHRFIVEYKASQGSIDKTLLEKAKKENIPVAEAIPDKYKSPQGKWIYQVSHIGDRHILLLKHLKGDKE